MRKLLTLILCVVAMPMLADGKYFGGDISLLPSYVSHGAKYLATDGTPIDAPLPYFGEQGMNAMRVRLFVNPENAPSDHKGQGVVQDLEYVKALGKQIKDAGMALMLDFHYSDTWADPVKQWTPQAWADLNDDQLYDKIYTYTKDVLQQMKAAGATPDFIQTGNEISYGMLWGRSTDPTSQLKKVYTNSDANWPRFTTLLKQAGKACREVCPDARIILHTERIANTGALTNFYQQMLSAQVDYDIIGTSYYSYYHGNLNTLNASLTQLENQFPDKQIMIVEAGYFYNWQPTISAPGVDLSSTYPISEAGQQAFAKALIQTLQKHSHVTGLFWWWMEANEYGHTGSAQVTKDWYNASLWNDQTGKVTPAFYELSSFLGDEAHVATPSVHESSSAQWFTVDGKRLSAPGRHGLYIRNQRKIIVK